MTPPGTIQDRRHCFLPPAFRTTEAATAANLSGDEKSAREAFQKGLDLERARDPQSNLCGSLMKWVASV